jgi:predicted MFS family arabinose efflux permease
VSGLPTTAASGADSDIGDGSDASPPPSIWRNRNFQLVWGGSFVNNVGDWLLMVALPVYVFTATDSGAATAALFVIELAVAVLLGPLGGSIVDRLDLPRTLIVTNLAQAAALLPLLTVTEARVWPAYIVAGVQAALARVNNPAGAALLPRLVARHQLLKANAAMATANSLARLIGAPIGGIAVELGGLRGVVVADGLTFVAVAVATWFVHVTARASDTHGSSNVDETEARPGPGVRAAWPLIRRTKPLPALLSLTAMCQLAQGMFLVLFVVFVVEELGGGGGAVGLIRGTMAVGGIAGGIAIARLARRLDAAVLLAAGLLGMGLVSLITWNMPELSTALWVYMLLFATAGPAGAALSVGILTIAQRATPPACSSTSWTSGSCSTHRHRSTWSPRSSPSSRSSTAAPPCPKVRSGGGRSGRRLARGHRRAPAPSRRASAGRRSGRRPGVRRHPDRPARTPPGTATRG